MVASRGIWAITSQAIGIKDVDPSEVLRVVRFSSKKTDGRVEGERAIVAEVTAEEEWKHQLFEFLTQKLNSAAFERLVQRLLREPGFTQVEVTRVVEMVELTAEVLPEFTAC